MKKKNVLLIPPLTEQHTGIRNFGIPSLGVHRIACYLRSYGYNVDIYDCNLDGSFDEWSKDKNFDIIGISILADTLFPSLIIIRILKVKYPFSLIVAGGIETTLNYQEIIEKSPVDAVVLGEGEEPMLKICEGIPLENIQGLVVKKPASPITNEKLWEYWDKVDFRQMPYRKYWEYNRGLHEEESGETEPLVRLVTSSHCIKNCSFCSVKSWHQAACNKNVSPAFLSANQIGILLERIKEQLPETKRIYFVEDDVLVTRKRGYELLPIFKKYPFKYLLQTSTPKITEDLVYKFAEANVVHITFGVESASEYLRNQFRKPQSSEKIEKIIKWCKNANIHCYYLVILFPPATRIADLIISYETLSRWIKEGVTISIEPVVMPYRGAPIWENENHDTVYEIKNGFKQPLYLLPDDPETNMFTRIFLERWPKFKEKKMREDNQKHIFKGAIGSWYVELLGKMLKQRGKI